MGFVSISDALGHTIDMVRLCQSMLSTLVRLVLLNLLLELVLSNDWFVYLLGHSMVTLLLLLVVLILSFPIRLAGVGIGTGRTSSTTTRIGVHMGTLLGACIGGGRRHNRIVKRLGVLGVYLWQGKPTPRHILGLTTRRTCHHH